MKIIIADEISQKGISFLKNASGFEVIEAYKDLVLLETHIQSADGLIVRSQTKVNEYLLGKAESLKVVGRAGVGVDNIDIAQATERGIVVLNTPLGNTNATAELTFTHLLCSVRPVIEAHTSMKNGLWERKVHEGSELGGKILGILGLGRIGGALAQRAQAFGMQVICYDPFLTKERAEFLGVELCSELDQLLEQADSYYNSYAFARANSSLN